MASKTSSVRRPGPPGSAPLIHPSILCSQYSDHSLDCGTRPVLSVSRVSSFCRRLCRFDMISALSEIGHERARLLSLLSRLRCVCCALQFGDARFDIFDLNCLGPVVEHAIRRSHPGRGRSIRVHHDLQQRRDGGARCLLQPCDGLRECCTTRLPVCGLERWLLQPSQQRLGCDTDGAGGFFQAPVREQGRDGRLLFVPEF
jgi:hypothetical protein